MKNTNPKNHRFPRHSAIQWRDIIYRFENGSMTAEVFCQHESIGMASFKKWRTHYSKLRKQPKKTKAPDFIQILNAPVENKRDQTDLPSQQMPWDIELELGNGVICRIRKG